MEALQTIKLKGREEMAQALDTILGSDSDYQSFKDALLAVAGEEMYPHGVNIRVQLAKLDFAEQFKGADQPYTFMLALQMDDIIEAIIEGDASAVKELRKSAIEAVVEQQEEMPDTPAEMSAELFEAMHFVGEAIHRATDGVDYETWERRDDDVNPYYGQLEQGLIIEYYYGYPSTIHTPLGKYQIAGGGAGWSRDALANLFANPNLKLELFEEKVVSHMGEFGPWYAVSEVKGVALPKPIKRKKGTFVKYDDSKAAWDVLSRRYLARRCHFENGLAQVKKFPDAAASKALEDQVVKVLDVNREGMAAVMPLSVFQTKSGVAVRVPLTDLVLFEHGHVTVK
jgi:hypothetical protein